MSGRSLTHRLHVSWRAPSFPPECHPPIYLAPLIASIPRPLHQRSSFSTTATLSARKTRPRDGNPHRGESALRRTNLKKPVGMSKQPLPQPVLDPNRRLKIQVDTNHGLWDFFNKDRKALTKKEDDSEIGRAWTVEELRHKAWEDLHALWYICCKERNRIATEAKERKRMNLVDGPAWDGRKRDLTIRTTQAKIKHTLTERWYAWEEAKKVAMNDPEVDVDVDGDTPVYQLRGLKDGNEFEEQPRAAAGAA